MCGDVVLGNASSGDVHHAQIGLGIGVPLFGGKPEAEFEALFTRIVNLAPPPLGLGIGTPP